MGLAPGGLSAYAVGDSVLLDMEPDFRFGRLGGRHELADGLEDDFELRVVLGLQFSKLASQVSVAQEHFPEADERAHDGDVHLHSARTGQDTGEPQYLVKPFEQELDSATASMNFGLKDLLARVERGS